MLAEHLTARGVRHLHNHIATATCTVAMLTSKMSGIPFSFTIHGPDIFFEPKHWRIDAKIAEARFVACISDFCRSQCMIFADQAHWTNSTSSIAASIPGDTGASGRRTPPPRIWSSWVVWRG